MASVYKPTYLRPIPPDAKRVKVKGEPGVKYTDQRGREHVHPIRTTPAGEQMVVEQKRWWIRWTLPDGTKRRAKGFTDRAASEQDAARREREAAQADAGLHVVDSDHLSAPIGQHIAAFIADLERAGRAPRYYNLVKSRLDCIVAACGWATLRQVTPDALSAYMIQLSRTPAPGRPGECLSAKTQNAYRNAAVAFCNWAIRTRRLAANPLAGVGKTEQVGTTRQRRALTQDEIRRLLANAGKHRLLYLTAISTGLRRGELKQLQWQDVHAGPQVIRPYIALRAATTKAHRADTIPLRPDVAAELLAAKPADAAPADKVFASTPRIWTFKKALERAEIPYVDATGRVADFHALRYTFGTMLAKAGVAPRVAMELMRHTSIELTMGLYTDPRLLDTAGAVASLPVLDEGQDAAAVKTGTDDRDVATENDRSKVLRQSRSGTGRNRPIQARTGPPSAEKPQQNRGFPIGAAGFEPATHASQPPKQPTLADAENQSIAPKALSGAEIPPEIIELARKIHALPAGKQAAIRAIVAGLVSAKET